MCTTGSVCSPASVCRSSRLTGSASNVTLPARSMSIDPEKSVRGPPAPVSISQKPSSVRLSVRCRSRSAVAVVNDARWTPPSSFRTSR